MKERSHISGQIVSFLPTYLSNYYHAKDLSKPRLFSERFQAAVMMVDISGYTRIAEKFGKKGDIGAEALASHLNNYFSRLIQAIHEYGGDVLLFAGDAMIAKWPAVEYPLEEACLQAARCAVNLKNTLAYFDVSEGEVLKLKISLDAGAMNAMNLGGYQNRWSFFVQGDPILGLNHLNQAAKAGKVIISEKVLAHLGNAADIRITPDGYAILEKAPPPSKIGWKRSKHFQPEHLADVVKAYIPLTLVTMFEAGHFDWLAEFRKASTMFLKLTNIDFAHPEVIHCMQEVTLSLQEVIHRYEGTLISFSYEEKGPILMIVFGLPHLSHDNDAGRTVQAAQEIEKRLNAMGVGFKIGITTGLTYCGMIGSCNRQFYSVVGDKVNLASRLMEEAEQKILCDETTMRSLQNDLAFSELPSVKLKGKSGYVKIFSPVNWKKEKGLPQPGMVEYVGRKKEMDTLLAHFDQVAKEKQQKIVFIEGEAGIGKTTLINNFAAGLRKEEAARLLAGTGDSVEKNAPYQAWQQIMLSIFGLSANLQDLDHRSEVIRNGLQHQPALLPLAPLLNDIFPTGMTDNSITEKYSGDGRAEKLRELVAQLLPLYTVCHPVVLIMENVHWLDSASWALLHHIVKTELPLFILLSSRRLREPFRPQFEQLQSEGNVTHLILQPLDEQDSVELIRKGLNLEVLPPAIKRFFLERAKGNPFYIHELLLYLKDTGMVKAGQQRFSLEQDLKHLQLPTTIEGMITSRIDRLPPDQKLTLKVASVIGQDFNMEMLKGIYPVSLEDGTLEKHLSALIGLNILQRAEQGKEKEYFFRHFLTREVAYGLMLYSQRRQLHHAIGGWIEENNPFNLTEHYTILAHHWSMAVSKQEPERETLTKAIGFLTKSAEQAMGKSAYTEATQQLDRALEYCPLLADEIARDANKLKLLTLRGYACMCMRGYGDPEVEQSYQRAHQLAEQVEDSSELGPILYGLFSYYASRAEYKPGEQVAQKILALGNTFHDPVLKIIGYNSKGLSAILKGDLSRGSNYTRKSFTIADNLGEQAVLIKYGGDFRGYPRAWYAIAQCILGNPNNALSTYRQALDITRQHPYTHSFILCFAGIPQLLGDVELTIEKSDALWALSEKYGFMMLGAIAKIFKGWAVVMSSQDPAGVKMIEENLPVPRFVKLDSYLPWYLAIYAEALGTMQEKEKAIAVLDEALKMAEQASGNFFTAELLRLKGKYTLSMGNTQEACKYFSGALKTAEQQGAVLWKNKIKALTGIRGLSGNLSAGIPGFILR